MTGHAAALRQQSDLDWPLMRQNVTREDLDTLIEYLRRDDPRLTQGEQVGLFEQEWSSWLGVKHSVFVNSGSSANLLTMAALKEIHGSGEVIVPPLTWVSDISAVLHAGLTPVFVDIDEHTLGLDTEQVIARLTEHTRGVFLTHILGYNALSARLLEELEARGIPLIEDVCESHGTTFLGAKVGTFGLASNFSFYYAHHMSTVEGGMICTDDDELYQVVRMLRSHGMVREASSDPLKQAYARQNPDLRLDFIFAFPAYNVRSTELNAVLGRAQLPKLDEHNEARRENLAVFLAHLDPSIYRTDFACAGNSNYALTLVLRRADDELCARVMSALSRWGVEFRRGLSGGGNQLRQPYLRRYLGDVELSDFPNVDHVHFYGFYLGNYPSLSQDKIVELCQRLNQLGG